MNSTVDGSKNIGQIFLAGQKDFLHGNFCAQIDIIGEMYIVLQMTSNSVCIWSREFWGILSKMAKKTI